MYLYGVSDMKYKNAKDILPQELVEILQEYYQQGYLYIPKRANHELSLKPKTDYKIELEKRKYHANLPIISKR